MLICVHISGFEVRITMHLLLNIFGFFVISLSSWKWVVKTKTVTVWGTVRLVAEIGLILYHMIVYTILKIIVTKLYQLYRNVTIRWRQRFVKHIKHDTQINQEWWKLENSKLAKYRNVYKVTQYLWNNANISETTQLSSRNYVKFAISIDKACVGKIMQIVCEITQILKKKKTSNKIAQMFIFLRHSNK